MAWIKLNHKAARSVTSGQRRTTRSDEDEELEIVRFGSIEVIEEDQAEPVKTGLLDSCGDPIYRIPVDKPPIGFITPSEFQELYMMDPHTDFYYSTDE